MNTLLLCSSFTLLCCMQSFLSFALLFFCFDLTPLILFESSVFSFCFEFVKSLVNFFDIKLVVDANTNHLVVINNLEMFAAKSLLLFYKFHLIILEFDFNDSLFDINSISLTRSLILMS